MDRERRALLAQMGTEQAIESFAVLDYLIQQERLLPLGQAPQFERDESGELFALLDIADEGPMRMALGSDELPSLLEHVEAVIVRSLDGGFDLLLATGDAPQEAKQELDRQLFEIVHQELGEEAFQELVESCVEQFERLHSPKPPQKVKRNAPCPCGSGKKYKKCCMA